MRIKIEFASENRIIIPINYNHYVQALLYNSFSSELTSFLHEKGYIVKNRHFKLFTFSRLFGNYKINDNKIIFNSPIYFYLSSPFNDILTEFANTAFKSKEQLKLGNNNVFCTSISVFKGIDFENNIEYKIKMLSPVTVYSTINMGGKRRTYYYGPHDNEFNNLIMENLFKKYRAVYKVNLSNEFKNFKISPFKVDLKRHFILTRFKDTIIKGWMGLYKITGSPELLKIAYDAGIGSKNSAGFGMWEVVE